MLASAFHEGLWQPLLRDAQPAEVARKAAPQEGLLREAASLVAAQLAAGKVVVIDDALPDQWLAEARSELGELFDRGFLKLNLKVQAGNIETRTDRVCYIRDKVLDEQVGGSSSSAQEPFKEGVLRCHRLLRGLPHELELAFRSLGGQRSFLVQEWTQLAQYSEGNGYYTWHSDGLPFPMWYWLGGPVALFLFLKWGAIRRRSVTAIVYLNEKDWRPEWGGALHCRSPAVLVKGQTVQELPLLEHNLSEVWPVGGRLVLFDAQTVQHEVAHTRHQRWAMTVWIHE